jgi:sporulation protein YlmC with PRC-barrel domain
MTTRWKNLLRGGVAVAALGLGLPAALAQTPAAGTAAQGAGQSWPGLQAFQQAERGLRQALAAMTGDTAQPQMIEGARQAVTQFQQSLTQVPAAARGSQSYTALTREVTEASNALQGSRPDMNRARSEIEGVLAAIPAFRSEAGFATADAGAAGASGAQIVIREQAAQVEVQQAQPQVSVTQPEPVVTVIVPPPEIIVRQPPPQVTVQMPPPQVAVQQPQPQVRVLEAQPQVQVQPAQPQVQVQQAQPRVVVQQQGQPQLRFDQQGQPVVNIERQGDVAASGTAAPQPAPQAVAPTANQQAGAASTAAPAQSGGAQQVAGGIPLTRVQSLLGTNLIGANGQNAGEVENLLIDRNGQVRAAIVEWGGFLGLGTRRAAVPIEQIQFDGQGGRARLNMSREQLESLGEFDRNNFGAYGQRQGWGEGSRLFR